MLDILILAGGLVLLVIGGEALVRGSVAVAERLGMSPLLIGLTFVGFGTSMPELVTSVQAALAGSPGIAAGNIVGSNIANILLILGLSALITPIVVGERALKRDGVIVFAAAAAFAALGLFHALDRVTGAAFVAALALYIYYAYAQETAHPEAGHTAAGGKAEAYGELRAAPEQTAPRASAITPLLMALAGLVLVVLGGKLLVDGAVGIARSQGLSETLIGLTIVAIGTSMPEFVTSIVAALRKHSDVALGNILGSNIYNILGIGGVTGLISPTVIPPEIARFDNWVMLAASAALVAFAATGRRLSRFEGLAMLAGYGAYIFALWPK